ncbi:MAG: HD domain-containing protein [Clostridia bacterium]|nr:HD domain-containing protein [Clostridia bacterium]
MAIIGGRKIVDKIKNSKKEFIKYIMQFDLNDENITKKIFHTFRVMEISKKIAKSLNLNKEQIEIAEYIGLFHDISRFEQFTKYHTYNDLKSIDHGDFALEILEKYRFLDKFSKNTKIQEIIKLSIKNHNKYKIGEEFTQEEKMFLNIIRDADKLDIMSECINIFFKKESDVKCIEEGKISNEVLEQIYKRESILRKRELNKIDKLLVYIAFVFDFNYLYTFEYLKKRDFINKILNRFNYKDLRTIDKVEIIKKIIDDYIDERSVILRAESGMREKNSEDFIQTLVEYNIGS